MRRVIAAALALVAASALGWSLHLRRARQASEARKTITARKLLMSVIDRDMDDLETMAVTGKLDMAEGREEADRISILLLAVPSLFPASTNQWRPGAARDPGVDTYARPQLWTDEKGFEAQAAAASELALEASREKTAAGLAAKALLMRQSCMACHAVYREPDDE